MCLTSFLRNFSLSLFVCSNVAMSCAPNDCFQEREIVSFEFEGSVVHVTYEDENGQWTESVKREEGDTGYRSGILVMESKMTGALTPVSDIQDPPPFLRSKRSSDLFALLNGGDDEEKPTAGRAVLSPSSVIITDDLDSSDETIILEEDPRVYYDPSECDARYDLRSVGVRSFMIDASSVLSLERCKTPLMRAFVRQAGDLMDFRAHLHRSYKIPSSFEGRLKTLAVLLDDLYKEDGFRDLPYRLMDLLQEETHLTPGKIQLVKCLMFLSAQYLVQERDAAWQKFRHNKAYALEGMLKRYFSASQDVIVYLSLYENIFFFEGLTAAIPDFVKKELMVMAWQDRVKEAQRALEEPGKK